MAIQEWKEALHFACNVEFWRMAVFWTLHLIASYVRLFYQGLFSRKSKSYSRCSPLSLLHRMTAKASTTATGRPVCIITGATSGLGAAAACALSREGFYVILAGRSSHLLSKVVSEIKEENKDANLKAFQVNISSFQSILKFKSSLEKWLLDSDLHPSIQILINNAGMLATSHRPTVEGYDEMMATNYVGAFCLTKILLPLLKNSPFPSRIVNITSFTHRNASRMKVDKEIVSGKCLSKSGNYPFASLYQHSKLWLLFFTYELHQQLGLLGKSHRLSVVAADPGAVKTNIMREMPSVLSQVALFVLKIMGLLQLPENGVCSILDAALAPPEVSGVYFFGGNGRTLDSSALSHDARLSKELWAATSDLFLELQVFSQKTLK